MTLNYNCYYNNMIRLRAGSDRLVAIEKSKPIPYRSLNTRRANAMRYILLDYIKEKPTHDMRGLYVILSKDKRKAMENIVAEALFHKKDAYPPEERFYSLHVKPTDDTYYISEKKIDQMAYVVNKFRKKSNDSIASDITWEESETNLRETNEIVDLKTFKICENIEKADHLVDLLEQYTFVDKDDYVPPTFKDLHESMERKRKPYRSIYESTTPTSTTFGSVNRIPGAKTFFEEYCECSSKTKLPHPKSINTILPQEEPCSCKSSISNIIEKKENIFSAVATSHHSSEKQQIQESEKEIANNQSQQKLTKKQTSKSSISSRESKKEADQIEQKQIKKQKSSSCCLSIRESQQEIPLKIAISPKQSKNDQILNAIQETESHLERNQNQQRLDESSRLEKSDSSSKSADKSLQQRIRKRESCDQASSSESTPRTSILPNHQQKMYNITEIKRIPPSNVSLMKEKFALNIKSSDTNNLLKHSQPKIEEFLNTTLQRLKAHQLEQQNLENLFDKPKDQLRKRISSRRKHVRSKSRDKSELSEDTSDQSQEGKRQKSPTHFPRHRKRKSSKRPISTSHHRDELKVQVDTNGQSKDEHRKRTTSRHKLLKKNSKSESSIHDKQTAPAQSKQNIPNSSKDLSPQKRRTSSNHIRPKSTPRLSEKTVNRHKSISLDKSQLIKDTTLQSKQQILENLPNIQNDIPKLKEQELSKPKRSKSISPPHKKSETRVNQSKESKTNSLEKPTDSNLSRHRKKSRHRKHKKLVSRNSDDSESDNQSKRDVSEKLRHTRQKSEIKDRLSEVSTELSMEKQYEIGRKQRKSITPSRKTETFKKELSNVLSETSRFDNQATTFADRPNILKPFISPLGHDLPQMLEPNPQNVELLSESPSNLSKLSQDIKPSRTRNFLHKTLEKLSGTRSKKSKYDYQGHITSVTKKPEFLLDSTKHSEDLISAEPSALSKPELHDPSVRKSKVRIDTSLNTQQYVTFDPRELPNKRISFATSNKSQVLIEDDTSKQPLADIYNELSKSNHRSRKFKIDEAPKDLFKSKRHDRKSNSPTMTYNLSKSKEYLDDLLSIPKQSQNSITNGLPDSFRLHQSTIISATNLIKPPSHHSKLEMDEPLIKNHITDQSANRHESPLKLSKDSKYEIDKLFTDPLSKSSKHKSSRHKRQTNNFDESKESSTPNHDRTDLLVKSTRDKLIKQQNTTSLFDETTRKAKNNLELQNNQILSEPQTSEIYAKSANSMIPQDHNHELPQDKHVPAVANTMPSINEMASGSVVTPINDRGPAKTTPERIVPSENLGTPVSAVTIENSPRPANVMTPSVSHKTQSSSITPASSVTPASVLSSARSEMTPESSITPGDTTTSTSHITESSRFSPSSHMSSPSHLTSESKSTPATSMTSSIDATPEEKIYHAFNMMGIEQSAPFKSNLEKICEDIMEVSPTLDKESKSIIGILKKKITKPSSVERKKNLSSRHKDRSRHRTRSKSPNDRENHKNVSPTKLDVAENLLNVRKKESSRITSKSVSSTSKHKDQSRYRTESKRPKDRENHKHKSLDKVYQLVADHKTRSKSPKDHVNPKDTDIIKKGKKINISTRTKSPKDHKDIKMVKKDQTIDETNPRSKSPKYHVNRNHSDIIKNDQTVDLNLAKQKLENMNTITDNKVKEYLEKNISSKTQFSLQEKTSESENKTTIITSPQFFMKPTEDSCPSSVDEKKPISVLDRVRKIKQHIGKLESLHQENITKATTEKTNVGEETSNFLHKIMEAGTSTKTQIFNTLFKKKSKDSAHKEDSKSSISKTSGSSIIQLLKKHSKITKKKEN